MMYNNICDINFTPAPFYDYTCRYVYTKTGTISVADCCSLVFGDAFAGVSVAQWKVSHDGESRGVRAMVTCHLAE